MKLVPKDQETNQTVTWEDQQNINQFSKLNTKNDALLEIAKQKKTEKEYLDDLMQEIELFDDEEIKYKIGDCFVSLSLEEATERVENENQALNVELDELESKMETISKEMSRLKALLYGKFGSSINLERD